MELISVLGQYLLLAFVLPGACYVAVFILCFPGVLGATFPGTLGELRAGTQPATEGKDASQGLWISFVVVVGGLLISSVAWTLEILLRQFAFFDCVVFPRIPFEKISEPLANFFASETIMHFNIWVGILVILVAFAVVVTSRGEWRNWYHSPPEPRRYFCAPKLLAGGLAILVIANLVVSTHLFHRTSRVVYKRDWLVYQSKQECRRESHWMDYVPDWVATSP